MKNFLKYLAGAALGTVLGLLVIVILLIGVLSMAGSEEKTIILPKSILHLKLDNRIVDRASKNPLENISPFKGMENQTGLNDILNSIEAAKKDDNIKGIYLNILGIPTGIATTEEIRNALLDFKKSGKFVVSFSDYYPQKTYYLASVADKVYLNPVGAIDFKGLSAEVMFFKNALEKVGVTPQIIRHGKFKSAVEPFMLDKMSEANREQMETFMGSIWKNMLSAISKSRKISVKDLNMYADSMIIRNAKDAVKYKMVDALKYEDEIITELKKLSERKEDEKLRFVRISKYAKVVEQTPKPETEDEIAIIYASGEIKMTEGNNSTIGSKNISNAIRKARKDENVKAIVLRVNSPGGSALVSDIIWREMKLAKKAKPVIVSMGDYAASGGYYIACPAHKIVANPNTLTGSIGVFGLMFCGKELLNDKIGINIDRVKTNKYSDIGSMTRLMSGEERQIIQQGVEDIYDVFISHVAKGRNKSKQAIDDIGQGRVWSGANAKNIGLVDEFGGLKKALEIAAKEAKISKYKKTELPLQKDPMTQIMEELTGQAKVSAMREEMGILYKYYQSIRNLIEQEGVQARMPFEMEIY